jgi:drug/metabolite transporter (DMT)-like permease
VKNETKALLTGSLAPLSWSFIPLLVFYLNGLNAIVSLAISLLIFSILGFLYLAITNKFKSSFSAPKRYYLNGIFGVLGFHIFYFKALSLASPLIISLIINTCSILIFIYAFLIHKSEIKAQHLVGLAINFTGVLLIILSQNQETINYTNPILGYFLAFLAANCWALYSVLSQKFVTTPSTSLIPICLYTSILSFLIIVFQGNISIIFTINNSQLLLLTILGILPMGLSFIFWNYGVKNSDIRVLSCIVYANPILASIWLILFRIEQFQPIIILSIILIIIGSLTATNPFHFKLRSQKNKALL